MTLKGLSLNRFQILLFNGFLLEDFFVGVFLGVHFRHLTLHDCTDLIFIFQTSLAASAIECNSFAFSFKILNARL